MKTQLFTALLTLTLSGQWLMGATATERDHHFWAVKRLIDKEVSLIAEPEMAAFKTAGYPEGDNYGMCLRLLYCRTFEVDDETLSKEIPGLEKSISKFNRPEFDVLISDEVNAAWILRFVNPVLRDLLPTSPAKPLGEEKKARVQKRIKILCDKATFALAELRKQLETNKADEDKNDNGELDDNESMNVIRKGVDLRLNYCNAFYFTYLALREVLYRGDEFGLDPKDAEAFMQAQLGSNEQIEELGNWDWNFAEYQIFLRHRIMVMSSEPVRQGHKYGDYGQVSASFLDVLDTPLDSYPGRVRPFIEDLKMTALGDLLGWHIALHKNRDKLVQIDKQRQASSNKRRSRKQKDRPNYSEEGIKYWEQYAETFKVEDLIAKDKGKMGQKAAEVAFIAAQLYRLAGNTAEALETVGMVLDNKNHYYYGNARRWKSFLMKPPETPGALDWTSAAKLVDPEQVLNNIADVLSEARGIEDKKQRRNMYMGAAISLRNSVYSLQDDQYKKLWIKTGPKAYYQLGYVLYKLGMVEHAAMASIEGARAFGSIYQGRRGRPNPFKDKDGKDNKYTEDLQKLVQNMSIYSSQLRRVDKSDAANTLYKYNIKVQKYYPSDWTGTGPKQKAIAALQDKKYDEALMELAPLEEGGEEVTNSDKIWAARIKAYIIYLQWDVKFKASGADGAKDLSAKLDSAIKGVTGLLEKFKADKDIAEEAGKAKQMVISIEVGKAFRTEDYLKVLTTLDEEFWKNPPEEGSVLQKLANQMCGASYKYHAGLMKEKDPQKTIMIWPHIRRSYVALKMAKEKTGATLANSSKALAATYKNIGTLADWFITNKDNLKDKEFNFGDMNKIVQQAPLQYGNLMWDVVFGNTKELPLVLTVARTLHRGNDGDRAAVLYEQYLNAIKQDSALMAFRDDPKDVVDGVGDVIMAAPLNNLKKKWPEIRDLLVDKPSFIEEYKEHGGTTHQMSEEKLDYAKATDALNEMLKMASGKKAALGGDYEKVISSVTKLRDMAKQLSTYIQVMDYTVLAYLSVNKMNNALPYIKTLIAYDPIHPRYRALNVEIVLRQIAEDQAPPPEEIKAARGIAAERLKETKNKPDKVKPHWLSYCQVYELTVVLNEVDRLNKSLKRHYNDDITRILFDLAADNGDGTYIAIDPEAAAIIQRYLKLYEHKGITFPAPFEAKAGDDQLVIKMVKE